MPATASRNCCSSTSAIRVTFCRTISKVTVSGSRLPAKPSASVGWTSIVDDTSGLESSREGFDAADFDASDFRASSTRLDGECDP